MSDQEAANAKPAENGKAPEAPAPKDETATTRHSITIGGQRIDYTAQTGTMVLKDEQGKAKASIFYIAYTKDSDDGPGKRPLTFSFNGGPGSSSVWMHLGLLGPRRVLSGDVEALLPPPHRLTDNAYSLLDVTDLVFIDPVSTGYSRPAPGEEAKQFHGFERDIETVGDFIRLYTTRTERWSSPKFIIGESYGTTRACGLAGHLQERYGMHLNGLMLISVVLNFQTLHFTNLNDLPYLLFLPTYAATAWYHNRLDETLQSDLRATLDEVQRFAVEEYSVALMRGATLDAEARAAVVAKLARYTGLAPAYIERTNLRPEIFRFVKELLRDEGRTVGRLDSRFKGYDRDAAGERFESDPSLALILGAYSSTLNDYVRRELDFQSDLPYELMLSLYQTWDYSKHANKFVDVAETLRAAMTKNPFMQVFVANGYFDLATPHFATQNTFNHLGVEPSLQDNITMSYYEAGHMMYVHEPSLAQLKSDLAAFVRRAAPGAANT